MTNSYYSEISIGSWTGQITGACASMLAWNTRPQFGIPTCAKILTPSRGYNDRQHAEWSPNTRTPPMSQVSLKTLGGLRQTGEPTKNFAYSIKFTQALLISSSRTLVWATPDTRLVRDLYSQKREKSSVINFNDPGPIRPPTHPIHHHHHPPPLPHHHPDPPNPSLQKSTIISSIPHWNPLYLEQF